MQITNAEIKNIKKLKDKKYRKSSGLFLVEGVKLCKEVLNSKYEIKYTLSCSEEFKDYPNFTFVDYDVLKTIATTQTPQEIICVCEMPKLLDDLPKGNSLILDNLQDPGNLGTLIRSALAFGFNDIYFVNTVDIFSEKVIRSSMGAIFKISAHNVTEDYIIDNKSDICEILIGTDLNSSKLDNVNVNNKKVAVIIGNEGNGVSKKLLNSTDINITLEMTDKVESLNAGVAGSILMYELYKGEK